MAYAPGKFRLKNPPLALVLAQFELCESVNRSGEEVRDSLRVYGLERLSKKLERKVTIRANDLTPIVQNSDTFIIVDANNTRGVSVSRSLVNYFTSTHTGFASFLENVSKALSCLGRPIDDLRFKAISLRYVNAFHIDTSLTEIVRDSLGGIDRTAFQHDHHHHLYHFWCETNNGRLDVRFSTEHGDSKPKDLGHAEIVYPPRYLWSYDQLVGHLDIFETWKKKADTSYVDWEGGVDVLKTMNCNIEQAFLNVIRPEAMRSRFGAEELA